MKFSYQDNQSTDAFDISNLVTEASWETKRRGSPAKLQLTLLKDPQIQWSEGAVLFLQDNDLNLFFGYIFVISVQEQNTLSITAYDQIRYLKNKDTYLFQGKRADEILTKIAADFQLKIDHLPNTEYIIPSMIMDTKPLLDIILEALEHTLVHGGHMFYLWDHFGALQLSQIAGPTRTTQVGEGSLATSFDFTRSIDQQTYNRIELYRDNQTSGKRDLFVAQDSNHMDLWGILQYVEKADDTLNDAQIKEQCLALLQLHNQPEYSLSLSALAIPGLRAGEVLSVYLPSINLMKNLVVEEASHDLIKHTMRLKVKVI